jgi:hypothetical protein
LSCSSWMVHHILDLGKKPDSSSWLAQYTSTELSPRKDLVCRVGVQHRIDIEAWDE